MFTKNLIETELSKYIYVESGAVYENIHWRLTPDFDWGTANCAFYGTDWDNVTFRNCRVDGIHTEFTLERRYTGIMLAKGRDLTIDGLHIEKFPARGLYLSGIEGGVVSNLYVDRCNQGVTVAYFHPSSNLHFQNVRVPTTYGNPGPQTPPSRMYPGQYPGGGGMGISNVHGLTLEGINVCGETKQIKITSSTNVVGRNIITPHLALVGYIGIGDTPIGGDYSFDGMLVDGRLGWSMMRLSPGNIIQASEIGFLKLRNVGIHGGEIGDHGIQLHGNIVPSVLDAENCHFSGCNGERNGIPAGALHVTGNLAKANVNFASVNEFSHQAYIFAGTEFNPLI